MTARYAALAAMFALLSAAAPLQAQDDAAGEYRAEDSFEKFHGLLLKPDGTFEYTLSVGALDQRSSGSWEQQGDTVTLTTSPTPLAPVFRQAERDENEGAPFVLVSWPDGEGIPGIDITLGCADGTTLTDYTQYDGWSPPEGACDEPQWIELVEDIHNIRSGRFPIAEGASGLRFVLEPNDFGVVDLTGTIGTLDADRLVLVLHGYTITFRKLRGE